MGLYLVHPETADIPSLTKKFLHSFQSEWTEETINPEGISWGPL